MITGRQIRAARGLLEWSAEDLAKATGLARPTISNIEADTASPQERTLNNILSVFDKQGIEFTDSEGVKVRKTEMRSFSGKAGYRQLLDHIYDVMKDNGGRIRQLTSESNYLPYADDYADVHLERMEKVPNIDGRVLTIEGDDNFSASYCTYKWLPKEYGVLNPFYVYNDYVVLSLHEASYKRELVSIQSKLLSERYCEQFEFFWNKASVPSRKKGKFRL